MNIIRPLFLFILLAAVVLCISCVDRTPVDVSAYVTSITGMVEVKRDYKRIIPCVSMMLATNDLIMTRANSSIEIFFSETGVVRVFAETTLSVKSLMTASEKKTGLSLLAGKIFCILQKLKKDSHFEVSAGEAVVGVRGTCFTVECSSNVRIGVFSGKVTLRDTANASSSIEVEQFHEVVRSLSNSAPVIPTLMKKEGFTNMLREAVRTEWGLYTSAAEFQQEIKEAEQKWIKLGNTGKKGVSLRKPAKKSRLKPRQETPANTVKW